MLTDIRALADHFLMALPNIKKYEEIKRGKCPETRRTKKVRREVKMDKCPIVDLGVQDTHLREKKKKI